MSTASIRDSLGGCSKSQTAQRISGLRNDGVPNIQSKKPTLQKRCISLSDSQNCTTPLNAYSLDVELLVNRGDKQKTTDDVDKVTSARDQHNFAQKRCRLEAFEMERSSVDIIRSDNADDIISEGQMCPSLGTPHTAVLAAVTTDVIPGSSLNGISNSADAWQQIYGIDYNRFQKATVVEKEVDCGKSVRDYAEDTVTVIVPPNNANNSDGVFATHTGFNGQDCSIPLNQHMVVGESASCLDEALKSLHSLVVATEGNPLP